MKTNKPNQRELLAFIANAHKNTYAAPKDVREKSKMQTPFLPGHKCFYFGEGDYEYYDGYAGSEWAPGREIVLHSGDPIWAMAYQGKHNESFDSNFFQDRVFPFLKKALTNVDKNMPFRGPSEFKEGEFEYRFKMEGDYSYFTGRESVNYRGTEVFFQDVMGELIK
ncbi:hypothetical protein CMI41_02160 [Candidatus Pacearchaeota archaeon]|nr:hypothetical protein [Candidatus Pacearchaeota archaeon]|tara:strand:- start:242 stop:739 length:498 start_codon:yes stop_codon:yes gene_type:complete